MIKNIFRIGGTLIVIGILFTGLEACTHAKKPDEPVAYAEPPALSNEPIAEDSENLENSENSENESQPYALDQEEDVYEGKKNSRDEVVNSIKAPSNQVYYFSFDQNHVQKKYLKTIKAQARYLIEHSSAHVRLEGNTDDRGSREYNIGLGWRRAQAVAEILKQYHVPKQQIVMVSYGEERPAAVGDSEHARHLNRRVHLVYEQQ